MSSTPPARTHRSHEPRLREGAHRAGRGVVGALMPSVLAVAAVAALITALAVWQGEPPDQPRAAASTAKESTKDPDRAAGRSAKPAATPSETPTTTPESTTPDRTDDPAASDDAASDLEVVVLNQTSRAGLAGEVADRLRRQGWTVPAVGNFRGVVPSTTVYYPDGAEADALAAAADLPTEPRVRPRFGNLSTTRLTVVVTDSYPG